MELPGGYRRHLHHRTLLYVSSRCQYLTHASPDYTRGIGALLDVGLHVHLLGGSAGTSRKQTQSCDSNRPRIPGFGPPDERERDSETRSVGCEQRRREVTAGKRRTSTSDRSRANRDHEMEMGTCFPRNSRTGRIQIRSPLSCPPEVPRPSSEILARCDTNFCERHAPARHSSFHSA